MQERPLKRLSNIELIDIINHPERFTDEIISDAQLELQFRKEQAARPKNVAPIHSFQNLMLFKSDVVVTPAIVWLNIICFGLCLLVGVDAFSPSHIDLFNVGGMQQYHFLTGDWWRLFSSMFLHSGVMHIGFNMFALIQIGPIAEHLVGGKRYAIIYILCGIFGGLASISFGSDAVGVGASGAIFGIFGLTYFLLRSPKIEGDKRQIKHLANQLGFFIVLNVIIGLSSKGISNSAHVGGLVTGAIMCFIYLYNYPPKFKKHGGNAVAIILSIFIYIIWVNSLTPKKSIISEELVMDEQLYQQSRGLVHRIITYEDKIKNDYLEPSDSLDFYMPLIKQAMPEFEKELKDNHEYKFDDYLQILRNKITYIDANS
jgi:membrane associated rhomboid family serine protease